MLGKLVDMAKTIYHNTPEQFQFIYAPLKFIDKHTDKLRYDVCILSGEEKLSKQNMSIIYAYNGGSKENMNLITSMAFGEVYTERCVGKLWRWQIDEIVKENGRDCSFMILEAPKDSHILSEKNCCFIPGWIFTEVDVSDGYSLFKRNESLRSDLRKIKRNRLDYEISNEPERLSEFYYNMYVPYISMSHNKQAVIVDYDFYAKKIKKCDLLFVRKEGIYIAGCLISYVDSIPKIWSVGVKDASKSYLNDGAIGALFYYSIKYLMDKGYGKVSLGMTRAFLNDGVLRYKKKWGIEIKGSDRMGFMIEPLSQTDGTIGFLLNNAFVFQDEEDFKGAIFVNEKQSFTEKDFKRIYKDYYLPGISCLNIYFNGVINDDVRDSVPLELRDTLKLYPAEIFFKGIEEAVQ
jgi:hypothetical protein